MTVDDDLGVVLRDRISSSIGRSFPPDRVLNGRALDHWAPTTHVLRWRPRAVVRPCHRSEVEAVVRVLAEVGTVAAIGRGRNIGLGGRLGSSKVDFVVDLGDLREITGYDEALGTITVEAGTSFQDVHAFLEQKRSAFFLPAIGGPPDASVIGNALQRGDGIGPGGRRDCALLCLDAVLRDGRPVTVGLERGGRDAVLASGLGADLTALFVQSGLGIVTRATFPLTRMPVALLTYCLRLDSVHQLDVAIDRLRECCAQGVLQPCCGSLWSEGKRAARLGLERPSGASRWYVSGAFYGASANRVRADWGDLVACLSSAQVAHTVLACEVQEAPYRRNIYTGRPSDLNMRQLVYGLKSGTPIEPDAHGFAWVCPVLPFSGAAVRRFLDIVLLALREADMPENLALHPHSARQLRAFVALSWDRRDPVADERAHTCHDNLLRTLAAAGFPPFRVGHLSSDLATSDGPMSDATADQVAKILWAAP